MQSEAAGDWLVVIAHVVDLVCTTKEHGPVAVSDAYLSLKCRQTHGQKTGQSRHTCHFKSLPKTETLYSLILKKSK